MPLWDAGTRSTAAVEQPLGDGFPVDLGFEDSENGGWDEAPKQFAQTLQRPAREPRARRPHHLNAGPNRTRDAGKGHYPHVHRA